MLIKDLLLKTYRMRLAQIIYIMFNTTMNTFFRYIVLSRKDVNRSRLRPRTKNEFFKCFSHSDVPVFLHTAKQYEALSKQSDNGPSLIKSFILFLNCISLSSTCHF